MATTAGGLVAGDGSMEEVVDPTGIAAVIPTFILAMEGVEAVRAATLTEVGVIPPVAAAMAAEMVASDFASCLGVICPGMDRVPARWEWVGLR